MYKILRNPNIPKCLHNKLLLHNKSTDNWLFLVYQCLDCKQTVHVIIHTRHKPINIELPRNLMDKLDKPS